MSGRAEHGHVIGAKAKDGGEQTQRLLPAFDSLVGVELELTGELELIL
jgi:hypothetical protein